MQHSPESFVGLALERVEVLLDGALEQERSLRDDRDVLSQRVQSHLQSVTASDFVDRAYLWLAYPEQSLNDGALACPSPADDADLLAALDGETDVLEHQRQLRSVPHGEVVDSDGGSLWPLLSCVALLFLLDSVSILLQSEVEVEVFVLDVVFLVVVVPEFFLWSQVGNKECSLHTHNKTL